MKHRLVGARKFLEIAKPEAFFIPIDFYDYSGAKENTTGKIIQEFNLSSILSPVTSVIG